MELYRSGAGTLEARLPPAFPFQVGQREGAGRGLLATRHIRPTEIILSDSAIILGRLTYSANGVFTVCTVCKY